MWVVYNLYTYLILFTGASDECVTFLEGYPGNWSNPIDIAPKDYVINKAFELIINTHAN